MTPAEVPADLVEKAARAIHASQCCPLDKDSQCYGWPINLEEETARHALAAVLPEIQAQALRDAAEALDLPGSTATGYYASEAVGGYNDAERDTEAWLVKRAARLTATTEEPTDG
jgi:hypothetical protein